MRVRTRLLLTSAALATALVVTAQPAQASDFVVLSAGHVDVFDVAFEDGELELLVHDETVEPDVERDPADVLFRVLPGARTTVSSDPQFSFLGNPGDPVWILPDIDVPTLLFAGWGSEEVPDGAFVGDSVQLTVRRVSGPDDFSLFQVDGFGVPTVLVDSGNGLPDTFTIPAGTHAHGNWAFEAKGFYRLVVEVSGVLAATGERVTTGPVGYNFVVGF